MNVILRPDKREKICIVVTLLLHMDECIPLGVEHNLKNVQILIYCGCSNTFIMVNLISKIQQKKDFNMQWQMQAGNFTANQKG